MKEKIIKTLEEQLELLAKASKDENVCTGYLADFTESMINVATLLLAISE